MSLIVRTKVIIYVYVKEQKSAHLQIAIIVEHINLRLFAAEFKTMPVEKGG